MQFVLVIDVKATEHCLHRQGICSMKHIDVADLRLQSDVRSNRLKVLQVESENNVADSGTEALSRAVIATHAETPSIRQHVKERVAQMKEQATAAAIGDHFKSGRAG